MIAAYIGLGSNLGDRRETLAQARQHIASLAATQLTGESGIYETAPVGPQDQPSFLNQVVSIETTQSPGDLMAALLGIETQLGRAPRTPENRWGPRVIDLDLLLFGDQTVDQPGLSLPHPRMHERWFVLRPLADLTPDLLIPGQSEPVSRLLDRLKSGAAK